MACLQMMINNSLTAKFHYLCCFEPLHLYRYGPLGTSFVQATRQPSNRVFCHLKRQFGCLYFSSIPLFISVKSISAQCNLYRNFQYSLHQGRSSVVLVDDFSRKKRVALEISLGKPDQLQRRHMYYTIAKNFKHRHNAFDYAYNTRCGFYSLVQP